MLIQKNIHFQFNWTSKTTNKPKLSQIKINITTFLYWKQKIKRFDQTRYVEIPPVFRSHFMVLSDILILKISSYYPHVIRILILYNWLYIAYQIIKSKNTKLIKKLMPNSLNLVVHTVKKKCHVWNWGFFLPGKIMTIYFFYSVFNSHWYIYIHSDLQLIENKYGTWSEAES